MLWAFLSMLFLSMLKAEVLLVVQTPLKSLPPSKSVLALCCVINNVILYQDLPRTFDEFTFVAARE